MKRQKSKPQKDDDSISLNKYISSQGICSRRTADQWIEAGRVQLNGKTARKGNRVYPGDTVIVDGQRLRRKKKTVYIMLYKEKGITCTTDQRDPTNIVDYVNFKERIFPIGRLDKDSTGLILMTNDGDIVNKILRKENKHEKEYIVSVDRPIDDEFVRRMSRPIPILGTKTLPCKVTKIGTNTFKIILTQGLNRQIRRMTEYCGYRVIGLKRVRIMHLKLKNLKPGQFRYLTDEELEQLMKNI